MANMSNERVKRLYFKSRRGAQGYSEQTIAAMERALHCFEESTAFKDFKTFSERQATGFKKWLDDRRHRGDPLSSTTKYHLLRHLNAFFTWLVTQNGYRSRISLDAVSYLSLDKKMTRDALTVRPRPYPSLEQVLALVDSIKPVTDMDRRDRAMVAILILTGIRHGALCSLRIDSLDVSRLVVHQDPRFGVQTKGGKVITTWVLPFDEGLIQCVREWVEFLTGQLKYGPSDPLFPRTAVVQAADGYTFEANHLEPVFWRGGNSVRQILKMRSEAAGLPYFGPHAYRHAASRLAIRYCRTPEQFKALSQNFGHEQVLTTLRTYGELDDDRVAEVIAQMDFSVDATQEEGMIPASALQALLRNAQKRT